MNKTDSIKFKKNESFYIRDGWFEKALNAVKINENVFSKNNGSQLLGIGSNMVKSLKYWLQAANIITVCGSKTTLTKLGEMIYKFDRYFENDFTWYLVHYNLCSNKFDCPIFYAFFNSPIKKITKSQLNEYMLNAFPSNDVKVKSEYIEDDLNVFLRSYINGQTVDNPEDNYACPLSNLKLIEKYEQSVEKERPSFAKLSSLLIYYALTCVYNYNSFIIEDSFEKNNSPFLVFNLDKSSYLQYLENLQRNGFLTINKTAGLNTVYFEKRLSLPKIFETYFGGTK